MEDKYSTFEVTFDEKTKKVDDVIPAPDDDASSVQSSVPSLIKDADNYVRGLFSGLMGSSSDDDSSVAEEKKENKEDEEEEEKPLLVQLKDAFKSTFDKRGVALLVLIFLVGCLIYMHKNGHLANFTKMLPLAYLTGEAHDHHHHHNHGHAGCTCKNKGAAKPVEGAPAGECPCQRAKRLAEEAAAKAAAEGHEHSH
ncbi:hypothetical protein, conserved [Plasmodium vivax]|uniref:Uncharacterized protein n=1 Tax=Plasmodium vivax (strain Salvador I) TaxID=126793 RepID=A5K2V3_PLAVS|nr:hypothetical protein, conserved [Plasmodium vivax]EDL46753.1 hypothetical protein, conserved [Plasmodium vivax]|eukprot:XP_001616480.1 hypothetical protein [Plasmodium vivax Sal-1]